ncbi:MAG: hypothetical protein WC496_02715 [Phycisphaerae bacterium]|jgi:stress-induced morphogen
MVINEKMMAETIQQALAEQDDVRSVMTYDEAGMLTRNNGLVVRTGDGSEFQITVVQSR